MVNTKCDICVWHLFCDSSVNNLGFQKVPKEHYPMWHEVASQLKSIIDILERDFFPIHAEVWVCSWGIIKNQTKKTTYKNSSIIFFYLCQKYLLFWNSSAINQTLATYFFAQKLQFWVMLPNPLIEHRCLSFRFLCAEHGCINWGETWCPLASYGTIFLSRQIPWFVYSWKSSQRSCPFLNVSTWSFSNSSSQYM